MLEKFRAGGTALVRMWWAFALTAVLMVPLVVLLSRAAEDADPTLLALATTVGVLAALVQFLGLIRWPFLVPTSPAPPRPGRRICSTRPAAPVRVGVEASQAWKDGPP